MAFVRNTIRMKVDPKLERKNNVVFLVRDVIEEKTGTRRTDIFSVNEFPRQGLYDVTFVEEGKCLDVYEWLRNHANDPLLDGVAWEPLFGLQEKLVTVTVYNPYTEVGLLESFLARYCSAVGRGERQKNILGIFNCKYKFRVKLRQDPSCVGGFMHPPANFSVAGHRGFLTYAGQPRFCRKCFSFGHIQAECQKGQCCRNCGQEGHMAGGCPAPKKCDMCGGEGHMYRDCPRSERPRSERERKEEEEQRRGREELLKEMERLEREERSRAGEKASTPVVEGSVPGPSVQAEAESDPEDANFWKEAAKVQRGLEKKEKKKEKQKKKGPSESTFKLPAMLSLGEAMDTVEEAVGAVESQLHPSDPQNIGDFSSGEEPGGRKCPREGGGNKNDDEEEEIGAPLRKTACRKRWSDAGNVSGSETSCSLQTMEEDSGDIV